MIRTAQRRCLWPIFARGRNFGRSQRHHPRAVWLMMRTTCSPCPWRCSPLCYVAIYTPLKPYLRTFIGRFPAPWDRCLAGPLHVRTSSGRPSPSSPSSLSGSFPLHGISWLYRDDYARAGIRMLPVVQPDGWSTVAEALFFAVVMIPVSLLPWYLGVANTVYAVLAVLLGLLYLAYTIRFAGILHAKDETESRMLARDLLKVSVLYLPLLFTTLMLCATQKHYSGFDSGAYRRIEAKCIFLKKCHLA